MEAKINGYVVSGSVSEMREILFFQAATIPSVAKSGNLIKKKAMSKKCLIARRVLKLSSRDRSFATIVAGKEREVILHV